MQCASDCPEAGLVNSRNLLWMIGVRGSGGSQASPQGSFCPWALRRETTLGRRVLLLCLWHRDARGHWASGPGAALLLLFPCFLCSAVIKDTPGFQLARMLRSRLPLLVCFHSDHVYACPVTWWDLPPLSCIAPTESFMCIERAPDSMAPGSHS